MLGDSWEVFSVEKLRHKWLHQLLIHNRLLSLLLNLFPNPNRNLSQHLFLSLFPNLFLFQTHSLIRNLPHNLVYCQLDVDVHPANHSLRLFQFLPFSLLNFPSDVDNRHANQLRLLTLNAVYLDVNLPRHPPSLAILLLLPLQQ